MHALSFLRGFLLTRILSTNKNLLSGEMSMKNNYEFVQDYCGTIIMKTSVVQFKDGVLEQGKGDASQMVLVQGNGPNFNGNANGRLYNTRYIKHCFGGPICGPCCIRNTFEIEGYGTKLAETTIPNNTCCVCTPEYPVADGQEKALGTMKLNCIGLIIWCLRRLEVTTFNRPQTYTIPRPCCRLPCCAHWDIKDATGNNVGEIDYNGGLCLLKHNWTFNFFGNLSNQDKLLFLSSVPFLP